MTTGRRPVYVTASNGFIRVLQCYAGVTALGVIDITVCAGETPILDNTRMLEYVNQTGWG
jgi:hypothetical protein